MNSRIILLAAFVALVSSQDTHTGDSPNEYYDLLPDEDLDTPNPDDEVRMPPSIEVSPEPVIVYRSEEIITLDCEAVGEPSPSYHWYRNNAPLDENLPNIFRVDPNKGTIRIDPATALDEGYYQCFAENSHGKALSDVSFLQRAVISPYPSKPEETYQGVEGEGLKVLCDMTKCVPKPTHSWVIAKDKVDENPVPVVFNERVQMDANGNLYFAHLEQSDHQGGKLYKCIAFNAYLDVYTGGSYSIVKVTPKSGDKNKAPTVAYNTPTPTVGLVGESVTLKCLFNAYPTPNISWRRRDGKALPIGRHSYPDRRVKKNTELSLEKLEYDDEGEYVCTAQNTVGSAEAIISLDIQAKPTYAEDNGELAMVSNVNATNNDTIRLNCRADGEPLVNVQWYMNGEPIQTDLPPSRMSFENDDHTLVIKDLCKTCGGVSRTSDLMVIQCNASNDHGYAFSAGYLNVLMPTVMLTGPVNVDMEYYKDVVFNCKASSDPSTPVTYEWLWNNAPVKYEPGRVQQDDDGSLRLITKNEDDGGMSFEGEYTCVATNGYSRVTAVAMLAVPEGPVPASTAELLSTSVITPGPSVKGANLSDIWWIFLIVALILLLLILLLCCCLCCQRNRGDTYPVDEKERKNGNDPEKELANDGYADYQRPEDEPVKGSRASLTSTIKLDSDEEGSLAEYGDIDAGKFNEDGSFIGQYSTDKRKRAGNETNV